MAWSRDGSPAPVATDGGLSGWLRVGIANGDINRAENYLGAGLVYTGLIKGRDKDEIGFAIARAGLGEGARHAGALAGGRIGDAETDLEATYRYAFKDWLNIQPDVQYVIHPGRQPAHSKRPGRGPAPGVHVHEVGAGVRVPWRPVERRRSWLPGRRGRSGHGRNRRGGLRRRPFSI